MKKKGFFNQELPSKLSAKDLRRAEEFDKRESGIDPDDIKVNHKKLRAHLHFTIKQEKEITPQRNKEVTHQRDEEEQPCLSPK